MAREIRPQDDERENTKGEPVDELKQMDADLGESEQQTARCIEEEDSGLLDVEDVAVEDRPFGHLARVDGKERLIAPERPREAESTGQYDDAQGERVRRD